MSEKITLNVNGKNLNIVLGKTKDEWEEKYGEYDYDLWSMFIDELLDGTLEIDEDIWYWLIDGRCYETLEET